MLSDCLSPHVDACQIERGPEFIDWMITEVAIEGLVGFRSVWATLGGGCDWVLEQLGMVRVRVCVCVLVYVFHQVLFFLFPRQDARTNIPTVSPWMQSITYTFLLWSVCLKSITAHSVTEASVSYCFHEILLPQQLIL